MVLRSGTRPSAVLGVYCRRKVKKVNRMPEQINSGQSIVEAHLIWQVKWAALGHSSNINLSLLTS